VSFEQLLRDAYNECIKEFLEDTKREPCELIHVSDILSCLRRSYLYTTKPVEITPNYSLFSGVIIHRAIEDRICKKIEELAKERYDLKSKVIHETEISDGILIGTPDIVVILGDTVYVLELKTTKYYPVSIIENYRRAKYSPRGLDVLRNNLERIMATMHDKYIKQAQIYMCMLKKQGYKDVRGYVVYVRRTDGKMTLDEVPYSEHTYSWALKRAEKLYRSYNTGEEPKPEPSILCSPYFDKEAGKIISRCPYYNTCPVYRKI